MSDGLCNVDRGGGRGREGSKPDGPCLDVCCCPLFLFVDLYICTPAMFARTPDPPVYPLRCAWISHSQTGPLLLLIRRSIYIAKRTTGGVQGCTFGRRSEVRNMTLSISPLTCPPIRYASSDARGRVTIMSAKTRSAHSTQTLASAF